MNRTFQVIVLLLSCLVSLILTPFGLSLKIKLNCKLYNSKTKIMVLIDGRTSRIG